MNSKIYEYNDGESQVFGDPTEIDYYLESLGIEDMLIQERFDMIPSDDAGVIDRDRADKNDLRLLIDTYHDADPLIRRAFKLKPFDRTTGTGLLFGEVIELTLNYMQWRNGVKKNTGPRPNSASPTASTSDSSPTA